ncbi:outer membrane beta-barrel protein [Winogradskyella eckloniae]|uniref:outer membrane beta-barrel protein n=1 Tax=Winogradskyella eckloniae TaxID=1089306 RepID=UPI0015631AC6|nr:outer membrane beta-barrel protein [Winogradskyella eckloniae]NRD21347.1 outer membrane beta-barrel protein [Winogradskyella eckloniae]
MKKIFLIVLIASFSLSSFAQRDSNEWFLSIGVNAINSLGSKNPIYHPEDWTFEFPISAAVEFNWSEDFSIEQSITFNGFAESSKIDVVPFGPLPKDYNYVSLDTHLKYYFRRHILPDTDWVDFYANAGIGFFHIDETNISANLGGGVLFWLNKNRSFGLRAQTIAKFAFNHKESGFDNNHYQYHLQAIFKL